MKLFIYGVLADIVQVIILALIWRFHFVPFGLPELKPGHFLVIMVFIGLFNSTLSNSEGGDEYLKKLINKKLASSAIAAIICTLLYYVNLYI